MAEVIPFPPSRRRDFIRRQAEWFLDQGARSAEANLHHQVQVQRETMLRRGIDPVRVDRECSELRAAIRGEVWRLVLTPEAG